MKILGLLSIIFILEVNGRSLDTYATNTPCLERCKCENVNNASLEISNCAGPINITSSFKTSSTGFENIRFNQVTIENVGPMSFTIFPDLESIEFNACTILNIHPEAFLKDELGAMKFANCKFGKVPNLQCDALEELIISNSNLKEIPDLSKYSILTILNLDGNYINTINQTTFEKLDELEEVNLTNNRIQSISPKLFNFKNQLGSLDLSNNLLTEILLEGTTDLEFLTLASNQLRKFDSTFSKHLRSLISLDLSHNNISEITQETLKNMASLEVINLAYNKLTSLDNNTFASNSHLEKIILDGNNIKTLPVFKGNFDVFQNLYYFSCRNCGLQQTLSPFTFGSMPNLVQISLSGNDLHVLDPKAFAMVHRLQILDLSSNNLSELSVQVFSDNKDLSEINLSKNPLKVLNPEYFVGLEALRKLDASGAHLTSLWIDNYSYNLSRLEQLIISNNSIEDITTSDLKVMPNLKYLDVDNNPIQCTLDLANLIKWLATNGVYSPEGASFLRTHERLSDASEYFANFYDHKSQWEKLAKTACMPTNDEHKNTNNDYVMNQIIKNLREIDSVPKVEPPHVVEFEDEKDDDDDDDDTADEQDVEVLSTEEIKDKFSLKEATYVISVTSVFVLTALTVLSAAVSITLVILKRNNTLNINNANIPRIKIPRWENMPSQKKHSGSIYRPLSEEILTPPTPKFNRYEFKTSPTVHGS